MKSSSARTSAKNMVAIGLVVVSVAAILICEQAVSRFQGDLRVMKAAADVVGAIESVGGSTLEEAYYQSYGSYLRYEADMKGESATLLARGVELVSVFCLLAGFYLLLVVRLEADAAIPTEQSLPPL